MANKDLIHQSPATLEQKVLGLIACIAQEKKAEIDRALRNTDLSFLQVNLLHSLDSSPAGTLTVNDLKAALVDESPNVSRSLNKLAELGLVEKRRSEEDQRVVHIHITAAGRKAHHRCDELLAPIGLSLPEKELKQLYRLLSKV